jgi:threonine dehydrogenase-like Zn-dependent dehydrogenase
LLLFSQEENLMNLAEKVADKALGRNPVAQGSSEPLRSETEVMKAITWQGKEKVSLEMVPRPLLTDDNDIIVRVTACTICSGSDSHIYCGEIPGMEKGMTLGHECCGVVHQKGKNVSRFDIGDRVVVAFDIACGTCDFCKRQEFTGCSKVNSSKVSEQTFGHAPVGFGMGQLLGSTPGSQAEFVRVPFADVNCYPIPDSVPDEKALYLSDVLCTSLHACELGNVTRGSTVAIWGLGPIGLLVARWCQIRGASRIVACESVPERIALARKELDLEIIDRTGKTSTEVVNEFAKKIPDGFDVSIECAGFRFSTTAKHKVMRKLALETDTADILTECFQVTRPYGCVSAISDYAGITNAFPVGMIMMRHLVLKMGQCPCQKYFPYVMEKVADGTIDPTFLITHRIRLEDAPLAYKKLFYKEDGWIKVFIDTR